MKVDQILKMGAIDAAPLLLGCVLCRNTPKGVIRLKIVETEAYHQDDPASHSFRGMTKRTKPMFQAGGRLYVYFTYGMHYCMNIVTGPAGRGEAVLLRAAEPLEGTKILESNRGTTDIKNLTNGPAKLTQALGIKDTSLSGQMLNKLSSNIPENKLSRDPGIWLEPAQQAIDSRDIIAAPRIGIREAAEMPWRFYIKDNPFVSK
jgi:DNA-3-methyladenine glycosylase